MLPQEMACSYLSKELYAMWQLMTRRFVYVTAIVQVICSIIVYRRIYGAELRFWQVPGKSGLDPGQYILLEL